MWVLLVCVFVHCFSNGVVMFFGVFCFISFLIPNVGFIFCWIFCFTCFKNTPNRPEPPKAHVVVVLDLLVGLGVVDEEEDPPEAGRVARDRR